MEKNRIQLAINKRKAVEYALEEFRKGENEVIFNRETFPEMYLYVAIENTVGKDLTFFGTTEYVQSILENYVSDRPFWLASSPYWEYDTEGNITDESEEIVYTTKDFYFNINLDIDHLMNTSEYSLDDIENFNEYTTIKDLIKIKVENAIDDFMVYLRDLSKLSTYNTLNCDEHRVYYSGKENEYAVQRKIFYNLEDADCYFNKIKEKYEIVQIVSGDAFSFNEVEDRMYEMRTEAKQAAAMEIR